jgi:hypothetical protein
MKTKRRPVVQVELDVDMFADAVARRLKPLLEGKAKPSDSDKNRFWLLADRAKLRGVSKSFAQREIHAGRMRARRLQGRGSVRCGSWLVTPEADREWLAELVTKTSGPALCGELPGHEYSLAGTEWTQPAGVKAQATNKPHSRGRSASRVKAKPGRGNMRNGSSRAWSSPGTGDQNKRPGALRELPGRKYPLAGTAWTNTTYRADR